MFSLDEVWFMKFLEIKDMFYNLIGKNRSKILMLIYNYELQNLPHMNKRKKQSNSITITYASESFGLFFIEILNSSLLSKRVN